MTLSSPGPALARAARAVSLEPLESRRLMAVGPIVDEGAVRIETNVGRITFLLTPDVTPLTVANFLKYVAAGRYDNTVVHRAVESNGVPFVVQGGGYEVATSYPHIDTFAAVPNEYELAKAAAGGGKVNLRGTIAMAKTGGNPDSATSEFFINLSDNSQNLDNQNGGFTTFARVIGSGMHVADTIINLDRENYSFLNSAFTDAPVVRTASGPNLVVISAARAQRVLPVTLDKGTKFVTWKDENGSESTISLSGGRAALTFIGGSDMRFTQQGNRVTVVGNNVTLEEVTARNTNKRSVLTVKSVGGRGPSHIGNITVVGGSLARIDADSVQLLGDINAADGSIGFIDLQGTYRSTIATKGGSLNLTIGTALTTTVNVSGGTLNSFRNATWFDDGRLPTTISARNINFLEVNGNFSSNVTTTGDVNRVVINGNVGSLGASTWSIGGHLRSVQARKVMGLTAKVGKNLVDFRVNEIQSTFRDGDATPTTIAANYIGNITAKSMTLAQVEGAKGIGRIDVSGSVDSSAIVSNRYITSLTIGGSLTGNTPGQSGVPTPSVVYAGVAASKTVGTVTSAGEFTNKAASISNVSVRGSFSNTAIAAPTLGSLRLGKIMVANRNVDFGVTADKRIGQLVATTSRGKSIALPPVTRQGQVAAYFSKAGIKPADLGDFDVRVV
jgi:peptidyl-prolyl cis-trans isomerase A (cyclophilin A)